MQIANWIHGLIGGLLIGSAAALLLLCNGRIAGISGIARHVLSFDREVRGWRLLFLAGLVAGAGLAYRFLGIGMPSRPQPGLLLMLGSGLLVGFGTALARGCTSGHGVCGLGRFSVRSLAAVLTFLLVGILTATLVARFTGTAG